VLLKNDSKLLIILSLLANDLQFLFLGFPSSLLTLMRFSLEGERRGEYRRRLEDEGLVVGARMENRS